PPMAGQDRATRRCPPPPTLPAALAHHSCLHPDVVALPSHRAGDGGSPQPLGGPPTPTLPRKREGVLADEATTYRQERGLGAVTDPELLQDVADVRLDRLFRAREPVGDLLVRKALGEQSQDIAFAGREIGEAGRLSSVLDQSSRDLGMQSRLAL